MQQFVHDALQTSRRRAQDFYKAHCHLDRKKYGRAAGKAFSDAPALQAYKAWRINDGRPRHSANDVVRSSP